MSEASPKGKGRTPVVIIALAMGQGGSSKMRRQVVHKITRTSCNVLKAIKFAATSRMLFTIDHSASAFVQYAGYAGFVLGDCSNQY